MFEDGQGRLPADAGGYDPNLPYRTLFEQSPLSMQIFAPDGTTRMVNRAWELLWGVTLEQIAGYNVLQDHQLVDTGIMPYILCGFGGQATSIPAVKYVPERTIPNISPVSHLWVRAYIYPVKDQAGTIQEVVLIHEDISELKQTEEALAERVHLAALSSQISSILIEGGSLQDMLKRCAEALVQQLDAAFTRIWTLNARDNMLELQASAGMYTHTDGMHSRVPVGQYKIGMIAAERRPHLSNEVISDPRLSDPEWARREGMVAFAGHPLIVDDELVGVIGLFARHPLTNVVLESMAMVAREIAAGIKRKQLERQKDEFLATASHELKTPVTAAKGMLQIAMRRLERAGQSQEVAILSKSEAQIDHLTELIDELLDVSRIETGKLALAMSRLDLASLIRDCSEVMQAMSTRHTIRVEAPERLEVLGDPNRLEQVVTNILGNALKYSPEGGDIEVTVEQDAAEARFSVRDYGIGIPAEDRPHIFERFQRASNASGSGVSGFGIGLYISAEIMRAHGGRIWLEDELAPGADAASSRQPGSRFWVALPLAE